MKKILKINLEQGHNSVEYYENVSNVKIFVKVLRVYCDKLFPCSTLDNSDRTIVQFFCKKKFKSTAIRNKS